MSSSGDPSTKELALLAALLPDEADPRARVRKAWEIWQASASFLSNVRGERQKGLDLFINGHRNDAQKRFLRRFKGQPTYPATLKQLINAVIKGRSWKQKDDRFVQFLESSDGIAMRGGIPSMEYYAMLHGSRLKEAEFVRLGGDFELWLEEDRKRIVSGKNSRAATSRHKKQRKRA